MTHQSAFITRALAEKYRQTGMHQHDQGQLVLNLSAIIRIDSPGYHWLLPKGSVAWFPCQLPHGLFSFGLCQTLNSYFNPVECEDMPQALKVFKSTPLLSAAMDKSAHTGEQDSIQPHLAALIKAEVMSQPAQPFVLPMPKNQQLFQLATQLLDNPASDITLEALAKQLHISSKTLQRRWQADCGDTLKHWFIQVRLLKAAELLSEGLPVTTVALDVGYQSISAFIEIFKMRFRVTPGEYQREFHHHQGNE